VAKPCDEGQIIRIRPGTLGASNPDAYREMYFAQRTNDQRKLRALLSLGAIAELPEAAPACALAESAEDQRLLVEIGGSQPSRYWVANRQVSSPR
jgi:hypothetical protein